MLAPSFPYSSGLVSPSRSPLLWLVMISPPRRYSPLLGYAPLPRLWLLPVSCPLVHCRPALFGPPSPALWLWPTASICVPYWPLFCCLPPRRGGRFAFGLLSTAARSPSLAFPALPPSTSRSPRLGAGHAPLFAPPSGGFWLATSHCCCLPSRGLHALARARGGSQFRSGSAQRYLRLPAEPQSARRVPWCATAPCWLPSRSLLIPSAFFRLLCLPPALHTSPGASCWRLRLCFALLLVTSRGFLCYALSDVGFSFYATCSPPPLSCFFSLLFWGPSPVFCRLGWASRLISPWRLLDTPPFLLSAFAPVSQPD